MPIVKCPKCQKRYDPGIDEELADLAPDTSMKVVCPACGQWLRLPEKEPVDAPDVSPDILAAMKAQSRLIESSPGQSPSKSRPASTDPPVDRPSRTVRRRDEDDERPSRTSRRPRDEGDERPSRTSRRPRDEDEDERPSRRRPRNEDDDDDRPRRASRRRDEDFFEDERDDYDVAPRRRRGPPPGQGLAITSMILGIAGTVGALVGWCCCGVFGSIPSAIIGIVAVVMGFIARSQGSKSGQALAGIILGFVAILIGIVMSVLIIIGVGFMQLNQNQFGGPGGGKAGGPGAPFPRKF